jgi:hypothetical protein
LLLLPPEVAVTLTVEVPAGVPVAGTPPLGLVAGGVESLPPQLKRPKTATITS